MALEREGEKEAGSKRNRDWDERIKQKIVIAFSAEVNRKLRKKRPAGYREKRWIQVLAIVIRRRRKIQSKKL